MQAIAAAVRAIVPAGILLCGPCANEHIAAYVQTLAGGNAGAGGSTSELLTPPAPGTVQLRLLVHKSQAIAHKKSRHYARERHDKGHGEVGFLLLRTGRRRGPCKVPVVMPHAPRVPAGVGQHFCRPDPCPEQPPHSPPTLNPFGLLPLHAAEQSLCSLPSSPGSVNGVQNEAGRKHSPV